MGNLINNVRIKLETEKRILSLLVNELQLIAEARLILSVDEFSSDHKEAIQILFDLNNPSETDIFINLKDVKGVDIFELQKGTNDFGISSLKKLVNELANQNEILGLKEVIKNINKKIETGEKAFPLYADIQQITESFFQQKSNIQIETFEQDFNIIYDEIEAERQGKIKPILSKFFPTFNKLTNGIRESNLIGIAGSYKSGKTSFVTALLIDFAEQNIPVCLFSLELSKREIISKIVSYKAGIDYSHLLSPKNLTNEEIAELNRFKVGANKLTLYTPAGMLSISDIKAKIRNLRDKKKVKIFFIDYLGYVQSGNKDFNNRERELTFFSNQLKQIAMELEVIIFVVAQLNRQGLNEPSSIHLAESIALARDCDYLFTITSAEKLKHEIKISEPENKFIVRLDVSRHSQQGKYFSIIYTQKGLREFCKQVETLF